MQQLLRRSAPLLRVAPTSESTGCPASTAEVAAVEDGRPGSSSSSALKPNTGKHMLSENRRKTLSSMYSLVGTHSAVKLCRWQKSMMRNRGGCYKWTCYGIRSHQCMEATPSMACANKCTFCWRHNTNPTATEWKWDVDDPVDVASGMVKMHKSLVKNASGMPGVTSDRLEEAMQPRHCALSLVGEPIIYPRVNEFLAELHRNNVSTFMVNNGQFPDAIEALAPVTQLYLSVDGPSKEIMKKLDRPVFSDFWERFNHSVDLMATKPGRKVFRLTMIEDVNMGEEHLAMYAEMIARGRPHFIELKQLTPAFQGTKTFLRLSNVPTWERVVEFGQKLAAAIGDGEEYAVACAHVHSSCLLLGQKKRFYDAISDKWKTWIDFDRFHKIMAGTSSASGGADFTTASNGEGGLPHPSKIVPEDYWAETPDWAVFGASDQGFDPNQSRHVSAKRRAFLEKEQKEKKHTTSGDQGEEEEE